MIVLVNAQQLKSLKMEEQREDRFERETEIGKEFDFWNSGTTSNPMLLLVFFLFAMCFNY